MNLHDIRTPGIEGFIWGWPTGGNGRAIGTIDGIAYRHVYRLVRKDNFPPLGTRDRAYFRPFDERTVQVLQPVCGARLKSRSRWPDIRRWGPWRGQVCPDCQRFATTNRVLDGGQELNALDPWMQLHYTDRVDTPDPITGR